MKQKKFNPVCAVFPFLLFCISCNEIKTAQIWTDRPEFAFYGELFNTNQTQFKVSVKYYENPGLELEKNANVPDIIVGSWLKNPSTGLYFKPIDDLFGANKLSRSVFYPKLLAIGRIDRNQHLLPVSFNLPALIFNKEKVLMTGWQNEVSGESELTDFYTINFDEVKKLSSDYNSVTRGSYTRMGFSPLWNDDFLMTFAILAGASFRAAAGQGSLLAWDAAALDNSMDYIYRWTNEINTSNQAEDEFTFKYFFEPPQRLIQNGRILFSYIDSRDLFTLSEENKNNLDFRWIMEQEKIPVTEDIVFLGIPKKLKSVKAARAFIQWFFTAENQNLILEYCFNNRINENVFGICGGFSALTPVTEDIYPVFYPELFGRMPPFDFILVPNVLPGNWANIKERVILPYLHERARTEDSSQVYPMERRLSDWIRMNR